MEESRKLLLYNYNFDELYELIKNGLILSSNLYDNKIINNIIKLETNNYREFINVLIKNNFNLVSKIEEERKKYVLSQIKNIDENGIFKHLYYINEDNINNYLPEKIVDKVNINLKYYDFKAINKILKTYTEKCLLEYIIDLYFEEITFNFFSNLKIMIKSIIETDDNIISKENLLFYKKLLNFHNLSLEEQKKLFYSYDSNINYIGNFYDDFYNCKKHFYVKINDSIIKQEQLNLLYNYELSNKNNIDIYELNGEKFFLYVHTSKIKNKDNGLNFPFKISNNTTISMSLIGHNNIKVYKPVFEYIILGFNTLIPDNIIHLFNSDSYTNNYKSSKKIQGIYTPDELLKNTNGYNEILYSEKNLDNFLPSYIVCFDYIRDIDLYFAKKEKLPIIKIKSSVYRKSGFIDDRLENTYVDAEQAKNILSYRML